MSHKSQFDLSNKVAIVTGASKGIGEAMAMGLSEYGARVVISSRSQEAIDKVVAKIKDNGGSAIGIARHVGHADQLLNLVNKRVKLECV